MAPFLGQSHIIYTINTRNHRIPEDKATHPRPQALLKVQMLAQHGNNVKGRILFLL
jgi:hypothetical protein